MQVTVINIAKDFGATPALNDVCVDIASGELVALLGPSGSGKTTLLRIVAGLETPTSGRVLFGDEDASGWPIQQRQVGFVFQHYALFKHMTVFDNIAFGLTVRPWGKRPSKAAIQDKVMGLLKLVQLNGLEARYPSQLSGGQRQRVALARALAIDPKVLLLDEPFGALDAKVRKDLRRWLRDIHEETGLTTLFVTHDQEEALELADRVVVLNQGQIEQTGTPEEIFDAPATPFVHDFIGEATQIPVTVEKGAVVLNGHKTGLLSEDVVQGPATLFLRPQHIRISRTDDGGLPATVVGVRRSGARYRVETVLDASDTRIEVETDAIDNVPLASSIFLKPQRWRLFAG